MLTGVFLILAGESIVGGSIALLAWTLFFVLGNLLYIPFVEEKSLEERFGEAYLIYKQNVPRWIPRSSAWNPRSRDQKEQVS
jgi:protein-S-isoprenylcysteine O-methyltransferase Ste14